MKKQTFFVLLIFARLICTLRSDLKGTQIFLGCTLIFLGCRHTLIFLGYSLVKDLRGLKIILPTVYKNCYSDASFNEAWIYIRVLTLVSTLTSRPFTCLKVCLLLSACCFATTKLTFILWSEYTKPTLHSRCYFSWNYLSFNKKPCKTFHLKITVFFWKRIEKHFSLFSVLISLFSYLVINVIIRLVVWFIMTLVLWSINLDVYKIKAIFA